MEAPPISEATVSQLESGHALPCALDSAGVKINFQKRKCLLGSLLLRPMKPFLILVGFIKAKKHRAL